MSVSLALKTFAIWCGICAVIGLIAFSHLGHGSVFYVQPIVHLGLFGGIFQIVAFWGNPSESYVLKALLVAALASVASAVAMALFWRQPLLALLDSEHWYVWPLLLVFAVPLAFIVSWYVVSRIKAEQNA